MYGNVDELDIIPMKIIEKNALSKFKRDAKDRKDELSKVLSRVENIYGDFEKPTYFNPDFSSFGSVFLRDGSNENEDSVNVEIVKDMPTLEQLLTNRQSRQKYVKQVTVFIVGYSEIASNRLKLMQEVNQFFISSEDLFESFIEREEKILVESHEAQEKTTKPSTISWGQQEEEEYTTSELSNNVQQAIETCQSLTNRLRDLNIEIIECLANYAKNKAGNKGRKKLEKSLENAVSETNKLNEKLSQSLKIISEKDTRIEGLIKQCEAKSKEAMKFKTAAESVKKSAVESDDLREQIKSRDAQILSLQSELAQTEIKIEQAKVLDAAHRASAEELAKEFQDKCQNLEKVLESQKIEMEETKRNIKRQHTSELKQIQAENEQRIQKLKLEHEQEIQQLKTNGVEQDIRPMEITEHEQFTQRKSLSKTSSEFDENAVALHWSEPEEEVNQASGKSSSNISKNNSELLTSPRGGLSSIFSKSNSEGSLDRISSVEKDRSKSASLKFESRQSTMLGSNPSSAKDVLRFSDAPELDNEAFWSNIPRNHLIGRFSQYRQLTMASMSNLLDEVETSQTTNTRQIHSLKSQHQIHQRRWTEEREMLIEAVHKTESEKTELLLLSESLIVDVENFISVINTKKKINDEVKINENVKEKGLIERITEMNEFLKLNNNLQEPLSIMIEDALKKCHLFKDKIQNSSIRKFKRSNLADNDKKIVNMKTTDSQTMRDNYSSSVFALDENKDIVFPEENEAEVGYRSIAISASPTLVRIAFYNNEMSANIPQMEVKGITAKDLETPRTGLNLIQHPIVTSYLQSYDEVLTFKEQIVSILQNLDNASVSEIMNLQNLTPVSIRSQNRIIPQIEEIGKSIEKIIHNSMQIIERLLSTRKKHQHKSSTEQKASVAISTKGKRPSNPGKMINSVQISFLLEECRKMRNVVKNLQQSYQSKFKQITVSMTQLQQLFHLLHKQYMDKEFNSKLVLTKNQRLDVNVLVSDSTNETATVSHPDQNNGLISTFFTRKDSERNIRRLQQELLHNNFPKILYNEAIDKMAEYLEIPPKQLYVLVRKYLHKHTMDQISESVKENNSFTVDTFKILDKMEMIYEKKQQQYKEIQEFLRNEKMIRAKALIDTIDKIETESSILMIKPLYTKKSRNFMKQFVVQNNLIAKTNEQKKNLVKNIYINTVQEVTESFGGKMYDVWRQDISIDNPSIEQTPFFESRLAEIDTNRLLLPINNVSASLNITNDSRLSSQVAVRSYLSIGHPILVEMDTISNKSKKGCKNNIQDIHYGLKLPTDLSKHIPLPPIIGSELIEEVHEKSNKENQSTKINSC